MDLTNHSLIKFKARINYCSYGRVILQVRLKLGLVEIRGDISPKKIEREAAWELYIELITRTSIIELNGEQGLLREALTSLYSLFNTTRNILRKYGYNIAPKESKISKVFKMFRKPKNKLSFALIALAVLNYAIRPILSEWHPKLLDYEQKRPSNVSVVVHEKSWEYNEELRERLNTLREELSEYSTHLEEIIGIDSLIPKHSITEI